MSRVTILLVSEPNSERLPPARKQLRAALQSLGWMPAWQELMAGDPALASRYRSFIGPFLVVNGALVEIAEPAQLAQALQQRYDAARKWAWLRMPLASSSVIPGILLAFFPKCAGCWAAYASVLGAMGVGLPYMPWLKHVLAGSLVLSALYFANMARRRQRWMPFGFQMMGFAAVLTSQYLLGAKPMLWTGVALVFAGSLLYAMPDTWMQKLERMGIASVLHKQEI